MTHRSLARLAGIFLGFLPFLSGLRAAESEEPPGSMRRFLADGKLTPELAARYAPAEQVGHLRDAGELTYYGSEAGESSAENKFFEEYTRQLRPLTDRKNPAAVRARADLIRLLRDISGFLIDLDGHHNDDVRIPGYAEWLLYSVDPDLFRPRQSPGGGELVEYEAAFTRRDVRLFVKDVGFTRWEATYMLHPASMVNAWNARIMASLAAFERHLNAGGRRYFRAEVIRFIDDPSRYLYGH